MAATAKNKSKKIVIDDNFIIEKYMNFVLENEKEPKNIYTFCKDNSFEESDYYTFFGSFDSVKQTIWLQFFDNAITLLSKDENYERYENRDKLLTLFYTLFEIFTLNRSYILYTLNKNKHSLKSLKELKEFRHEFKKYVSNSIISNSSEVLGETINKITKPAFTEGAWIQFLFVLKYWMEDSSKGFEKTDILIEKSITTSVGLFDTKQFENLVDLGKFLFKETR